MKKEWKNPITYILNLILHKESLLFERPGFEYQSAQTLGAYDFKAPWSYMTFFERSNTFHTLKKVKKSLAAFLMHFMLGQNIPKSYHNMTIDQE